MRFGGGHGYYLSYRGPFRLRLRSVVFYDNTAQTKSYLGFPVFILAQAKTRPRNQWFIDLEERICTHT